MSKSVTVVGGPFPQQVDPVLQLVPTGEGQLAARIADEFEQHFSRVERIGSFPGGKSCSFSELQQTLETLDTDVVVFLPHLPNILVDFSPKKLRLQHGETGEIKIRPAPKLVQRVKYVHPETLLVPFKLADPDMSRAEIVKWMLDLHAGLAAYSRLGDSRCYYIIDALGNEIPVSRSELPAALVEEVLHFLKAIRRRSERKGTQMPTVPHLGKLVAFSRRMQPAFSQIIERNAASGRWPGNFSFRCAHGFLSSRIQNGFIITRRDVDKTGLTAEDFVWVSLELENGRLAFWGAEGVKPSIDAPVHRIIYAQLGWVQSIVHGHLQVYGDCVHPHKLKRWPCGAENEGLEIITISPKDNVSELWVVNVEGHGFVALIGDEDPEVALRKLGELSFEAK